MTNLGLALKDAQAKKKKENGNGNSKNGELPDLSQFNVQEKTPEQITAEAEEAKRKDEWCRNAAPMLLAIRKRINDINLVAHFGPLSPPLSSEFNELKEKEAKLLSAGGDETLADHLSFSVFLEEIRTTSPSYEMMAEFLARAVALGRYTLLPEKEAEEKKKEWRETGKPPVGSVFFKWRVYLPFQPAEGEVKSKGQMALESVLARFFRDTEKGETARRKSEIEKIRLDGGADLSLLKNGNPGKYVLDFSKRTDDAGKTWQEGAGLVTVYEEQMGKDKIKAIKVLAGAGSLQWLNQHKGTWIPYSWYKKGVSENAPEHIADFAERFVKTIRAAIAAYHAKSENP
ncbi:MAG: hypothetical protein WC587_01980 [Candidatus Paceibacterota bacterium]